MDEQHIEPNPPTAVDVARRAAVLKLQFVRVAATPPKEILDKLAASLSQTHRDGLQAKLEEHRTSIVAILRQQGLWEDASPAERLIFECPARQLTMQQRVNTSWRAESIGVLAWAMGLWDAMPTFDTTIDPERVVPLIPVDVSSFAAVQLRPPLELESAREVAELWHWRSRTRRLQEDGARSRRELDTIVRQVARRAAGERLIDSAIDEDFPAFGKAYRELTAGEWEGVQSIALERHFALNWLCGLAPHNHWEETPTDT
jgi:hypothetical protein